MTQIAKGPNGQPMISLTKDEKAANEQQAAVYLNGLHVNADTTSLDGKLKRDKIKDDEMSVTDVKLDKHKGEWVKVTERWSTPREVPNGPHAGKWAIFVPADEKRMNERDVKTGEEVGKDHPAWKTPEIVEDDPSWWPQDDGT